jgi:hypothetical protein
VNAKAADAAEDDDEEVAAREDHEEADRDCREQEEACAVLCMPSLGLVQNFKHWHGKLSSW